MSISLRTTLEALNADEKRRGGGHQGAVALFAKAQERIQLSRHIAAQIGTSTSVKHVGNRVDKFDEEPKEDEEMFLRDVFSAVPLMQKSSRLLSALRNCLWPAAIDGEKPVLDPANILSMQVANLHKMKVCTARTCWKDVAELKDQVEQLQTAHDKLKRGHREMQRQYLREVSDIRDAARGRADPQQGTGAEDMTAADVVMFYEPMQHCEAEWQEAIFEIVKEKLQMIFDKNPGLESTVNVGQLTAMKALVESNQLADLKQAMKRKIHENQEMKFKIAAMEQDFKKLQVDGSSCSPEAVVAMDLEINKMKMEIYTVKKDLEATRKGKDVAESRSKELEQTLAKYEENLHELEMQSDDMKQQMESLTTEKAKTLQKLERAEKQLKTSELDLKQLKQSMVRQKKIAKGEQEVGKGSEKVPEESLESPSSSGVKKAHLNERTKDLEKDPVVKDALALAHQNEHQLVKRIEENSELRDKVQNLEDEHEDLQADRLDLIQEMAAMHAEAASAKVNFLAQMSQDLQDITRGLEDDDPTHEDPHVLRKQLTVLQGKVTQTEEEITTVSVSLQTEMAKVNKGEVAAVMKVSEYQSELTNLHKTRTAMMARIAIMELKMHEIEPAEDTDAKTSMLPAVVPPTRTKSSEKAKKSPSQSFSSSVEPGTGACPQCEEFQKEILALKKALKMYKRQTKEMTATLETNTEDIKALHETIEKLQLHNKTMLMTLKGAKGLQSNPEVQACIKMVCEAQRITVFDRLWMDSERRKGKEEQIQTKRRERIMQNTSRWVLHGEGAAPSWSKFETKQDQRRNQQQEVRRWSKRSPSPQDQEVTAQDLPRAFMAIDNSDPSVALRPITPVDLNFEDPMDMTIDQRVPKSQSPEPMQELMTPSLFSLNGLPPASNSAALSERSSPIEKSSELPVVKSRTTPAQIDSKVNPRATPQPPAKSPGTKSQGKLRKPGASQPTRMVTGAAALGNGLIGMGV